MFGVPFWVIKYGVTAIAVISLVSFMEFGWCNHKCKAVTHDLDEHIAAEQSAQHETDRINGEVALRAQRHGEIALLDQQKDARAFASLSARAAAAGAGRSCAISAESQRLRDDAAREANAARSPEVDHGTGTAVPDTAPTEGGQAGILVIGEDAQNEFVVQAAEAYLFKSRQLKECVATYNDARDAINGKAGAP